MPEQVGHGAPGHLRPPATLALWLAVGLSIGLTSAVGGLLAFQPHLPGRPDADALTTLVSLLGDLIGHLAGMATLGGLAAIVVFTPSDAEFRLGAPGRQLARWTGRAAQVWFVAAILMTFANPTFVNGMPLGYAFRVDGWWLFLTTTPSALAWLATAAAALATAIVSYAGTRTPPFLLCWLAGAGATVFVAVTGNVSVGLDHDWATDAVVVATVAVILLSSGAVGVVSAAAAGSPVDLAAGRRYHRAVVLLALAAAAGYGLASWQPLAGASPFEVAAGLPIVIGAALLALLIANRLWVRSAGELGADRLVAGAVRDLVLLIGLITCLTAATHLPPPRFLLPQSIQVNYLGYEVDVPATLERLVGLGRPNLLWVVLSLSAVGAYAWGMLRVRRAGGRWPVWRLLFWLAGWGLTLYLAISGLWMYSTAVFSWHMLVHMTINMMVPVLCVLGAPFGLIDAAARPRAAGELPGPRELLAGLAANRVVRVLLSPPVLWVNYIGSLFLVYFTPLFAWLMKYHWAHQLMLLHFLAAGLAFFSLVIGPEQHPWRLPYLVKFALLVSVMPFHAIFAVGIMMARSLIGENFYRTLDVAWVGDLLNDQNIAGQITWFTGEIPAFIAVAVLAAQWFRSDSREAARADRRADQGEDEMTAYNELLAELAERDRREAGRGPGVAR